MDRYAHLRNHIPEMIPKIFYGRLERVFTCTIDPHPSLRITEPETVVLCSMRPCSGSEDRNGLFEYQDYLTRSEVIDGDGLRAVVGRMFEGEKWVIVKRGGGIEHADYVADAADP